MKNLKKVLAFTLALAMILSTMTTAFAANEWADKLSNLGLLLNTTDEELNTELTRSVGLAMVLKALGYSQADADVAAERNTFVDMGNATWAKGFAVIGEELKITNGVSVEPKMFAPEQKLDKKSFVAFMLRALGYDLNEAWAKAGELGAAAKLIEQPEIEKMTFNKGEAAMIMYNALKAEVQGDAEKRSLAQKLVDEGKLNKDLAVANGLLEAAAATLEVESVSATNLREVNVEFNTKVDKASAEKAGNYKLRGRSVEEAVLQEDGKTVVLTLVGNSFLVNKKETKLTVVGVKTAEGLTIAKTEKLFTPMDVEYPKVEKVTFTGPKNLVIKFSEPVKTDAKKQAVTLSYGNRTYKGNITDVSGNTAKVDFYTTFKDGEEYNIIIGNPKNSDQYFYDFAGYPNILYDKTITYTKDTTAPEAEVKSANQKWVKVAFNKPVKGITKKHFYHNFAHWTAAEVYTKMEAKAENEVKAGETYSEVYVNFYAKEGDYPLPAGNVTLTILGTADKTKIEDAWGNKFATTNFDLTIVADREAPEVTQVEVLAADKVKVSFNKEIKNLNDATYKLMDKDGKITQSKYQISKDIVDGSKAVILKFNKSFEGKTMVLSINDIKDDTLYENKMGEYSTEIEFTDKVLNTTDWTAEYRRKEIKDAANKYTYELYVTFAEDMDDSALNAKNYKLQVGDNEAKTLVNDGDFLEGTNKVVVFDLKQGDKTEDNTLLNYLATSSATDKPYDTLKVKPTLLISRGVKDLAGNSFSDFQKTVNIEKFKETLPAGKGLVEAVATDYNKVKLTFKSPMKSVNPDKFEFSRELVSGKGKAVKVVDSNFVEGSKSIELTLGNESYLPYDLKGGDTQLEIKVVDEAEGTMDLYDRKIPSELVKIEDEIKPALSTVWVAEGTKFVDSLKGAIMQGDTTNAQLKKSDENDKYDKKEAILGYKEGLNYYVLVRYTEPISSNSLSNTMYEFNNGLELVRGATPVLVASNYAVKAQIVRKDGEDIKNENLQGLTLTHTGIVRDDSKNADNTFTSNKAYPVYADDTFKGPDAIFAKDPEVKVVDSKTVEVTLNYTQNVKDAVAGVYTLDGVGKDLFNAPSATRPADRQVKITLERTDDNVTDVTADKLSDLKLVTTDLKNGSDEVIVTKDTTALKLSDADKATLFIFARFTAATDGAEKLEDTTDGKVKALGDVAENDPVIVAYQDESNDYFVKVIYQHNLNLETVTEDKFKFGDNSTNFKVSGVKSKENNVVVLKLTKAAFTESDMKLKQEEGIKFEDGTPLGEITNLKIAKGSKWAD